MKRPWIGILATVVLASVHLGCGTWFGGIAKGMAPDVATGAVKALSDPVTQQQMVDAFDIGRLTELSNRVSAGVIDGFLDALEDPVRRRRLEALLDGLVSRAMGSAVDSIVEHGFGDARQARWRASAKVVVGELVGVIIDTAGSRVGSTGDRAKAFGGTVHDLAKQATLGFQEALDDTTRDRASGKMNDEEGSLVIAAGDAADTGNRILWTLGIGLGALALGLIVTLVWAIRKNRMRQVELADRDRALQLLAEAINNNTSATGVGDVQDALNASPRDRAAVDHIRRLMGERARQARVEAKGEGAKAEDVTK